MQKIKKGDTVQVMVGRDKGKKGKVLRVITDESKLIVEGVFIQKKHVKPGANPRMPNGGIIDKPGKIDVSNVQLFSDKLGAPVRVGFKVQKDGSKVRVARGKAGKETVLD